MRILIIFTFALLSGFLCEAKVPSVDDVKLAKVTIAKLINQRATGASMGKKNFWWIAGFLRLVWHDSVGKGGLDGCIDYANSANNGLNVYSQDLNAIYDQNFKDAMSRADFYALAAATALEMAGNDRRSAKMTFDANKLKFGRKDCPTSPNEDDTAEEFPSAKTDWDTMMDYFKKMFEVDGADFTAKDLVALMGAHKLGKATIRNSGYRGEWVTGGGCSSRLNQKYFARILTGPLRQQQLAKVKWSDKSCYYKPNLVWRETKFTGIMMNCDLALAYKFKSDSDGKIDCTMCEEGDKSAANCCGHSPGYEILLKYLGKKNSRGKWQLSSKEFTADFQAIIYRMMNLHHSGLQELGEDLPTAVKISEEESGFSSLAPGGKVYDSLEKAFIGEGALGTINWNDVPDLTAILNAEKPAEPKRQLDHCPGKGPGGRGKGSGDKARKRKARKGRKRKKGDEAMEDDIEVEDVSVLEELEDEIQDVQEDIEDLVDELENTK